MHEQHSGHEGRTLHAAHAQQDGEVERGGTESTKLLTLATIRCTRRAHRQSASRSLQLAVHVGLTEHGPRHVEAGPQVLKFNRGSTRSKSAIVQVTFGLSESGMHEQLSGHEERTQHTAHTQQDGDAVKVRRQTHSRSLYSLYT